MEGILLRWFLKRKWLCKDVNSLVLKPTYVDLVFLPSKRNNMFIMGDISVCPVLILNIHLLLFISKISVHMEMCGAMCFSS